MVNYGTRMEFDTITVMVSLLTALLQSAFPTAPLIESDILTSIFGAIVDADYHSSARLSDDLSPALLDVCFTMVYYLLLVTVANPVSSQIEDAELKLSQR